MVLVHSLHHSTVVSLNLKTEHSLSPVRFLPLLQAISYAQRRYREALPFRLHWDL